MEIRNNGNGNGKKLDNGNSNNEKSISTYSMWNAFRNCRKKCELRYIIGLTPKEKDRNLTFGSLIHKCLEIWHGTLDYNAVFNHINTECAGHFQNEELHKTWHYAGAMMKAYKHQCENKYQHDNFDVVSLEHNFKINITNPETGALSRSFVLCGVVDGIVRDENNQLWILEHKTTSRIDGGYIEKLWCDMQITLYSHYISKLFGEPVIGVIYNILQKPMISQSTGETDEEFEQRKAESKTGRIKRKEKETDQDFCLRLLEKLDDSCFHREKIYISRDQSNLLESEIWELTQQYLDCKRRNTWYRNTSQCFNGFNRKCEYWEYCKSNESPLIAEAFYNLAKPHEELGDNSLMNADEIKKQLDDLPF